jgi:transposase
MGGGMPARGRPKAELVLSTEERLTLERLANGRKSAQALAVQARIVMACAEGDTNQAVAENLGAGQAMMGKWRRRVVEHRLDGFFDEPRRGAPRTISDDQVEAVAVKTLQRRPKDATHWSTRGMAKEVGFSETTLRRIWRAFSPQPHRAESFKLSTDPLFIEKVRDVIAPYLDPRERAVVLCINEKSQIKAPNRFRSILPMVPGAPGVRSHDDVWHGTTSLFAAFEIATGKVIGSLKARHQAQEFKKFRVQIHQQLPNDLRVHLMLDNYATHKTPEIQRWLLRHPRSHLHFTPTSELWLNMVEPWIRELTTKKIKRGAHTSVKTLEKDIHEWIENPQPYV